MNTAARELFGKAYQMLSDRDRWEQKQRLYYKMRHDGLRRRNKPFPNAADLHLALIDEALTKQKPFWMAQATGTDKLASFVSKRRQLQDKTQSASDYFDFVVKQQTAFLRKLETAIDTMLLRGRGVLKIYVDPFDDYKIVVEAVDPLFILMDDGPDSFEDADEFVHVRHVSVGKFRRDRRYLGADQIERLRGGKDVVDRLKGQRDQNFENIFQDKELREGITHSAKSDTIVLWEHYVQTQGGWTMYTYAPIAIDVQVRQPVGVPFKVNGQVSIPFFSFQAEVKDEGWYSPRGLAEKIAPEEMFGCKLWNEWADAITWFNRPMITSDTALQNPANFRWQPGEYIPGNVKAVQMGQPGVSYAEQMSFARSEAEQKTQSPDFGVSRQQLPREGGSEKRTAREISYIQGVQSAGTNHNGMLLKQDLAKVYRHIWGLILQFKRKDLSYFVSDDLKQLPEDALHGDYLIMPGGSTDDWDKSQRIQKAVNRLNAFKGAPNVNQDELVKDVLTADDARLVGRLLMPQGQKAASESEDEAQEITSMIVTHYPAPVMPTEDHLTRVKIILSFFQAQGQKGRMPDPLALQRIQQHMAVHMQYLKQLQPQAYKQVLQMIQQMERQPMAPTAGTGTQRPPNNVNPPQMTMRPAGAMSMI